MKKAYKDSNKKFIKEYNELMSRVAFNMPYPQEWKEKGDQIEKFTMYDSYSTVKTSTDTNSTS
ncbi:hypothetical protein GYB22_05640 [bacterium]|nr:hypothetical protein [bacterium]